MKIELKNGTLIGLFTDHTISKPCPTCTYGMTVIREIVFRIKQEVVKDYKLEKKVNMKIIGRVMTMEKEQTLLI